MKIREPDRTEERIKQSKWYGNEEVISDVGKLIRCKDCKHRYDGETTKNCCDLLMEFTQWTREINVDLDFYCGYGEPKDGEQ